MFDTLREILVDQIKVAPETVTPDASVADVELDSLSVVELSIILEQQLAIIISDDELTNAATIGDIAQLMVERNTHVRSE